MSIRGVASPQGSSHSTRPAKPKQQVCAVAHKHTSKWKALGVAPLKEQVHSELCTWPRVRAQKP
eukprot:7902873-Alexandrium_andersonii.AAC.1